MKDQLLKKGGKAAQEVVDFVDLIDAEDNLGGGAASDAEHGDKGKKKRASSSSSSSSSKDRQKKMKPASPSLKNRKKNDTRVSSSSSSYKNDGNSSAAAGGDSTRPDQKYTLPEWYQMSGLSSSSIPPFREKGIFTHQQYLEYMKVYSRRSSSLNDSAPVLPDRASGGVERGRYVGGLKRPQKGDKGRGDRENDNHACGGGHSSLHIKSENGYGALEKPSRDAVTYDHERRTEYGWHCYYQMSSSQAPNHLSNVLLTYQEWKALQKKRQNNDVIDLSKDDDGNDDAITRQVVSASIRVTSEDSAEDSPRHNKGDGNSPRRNHGAKRRF